MRPYLRVANVFEDRIDTDDVMQINFTPREAETYKLRIGDILLNEGQSKELVGRPAMSRGEVPGACFTNTLVRFRSRSYLKAEYALIVFRCYLHSGRFREIARITTNIAHLGADRFSNIEFPLPSLAEQEEIVVRFDEMNSQISNLEHQCRIELQHCTGLRQSVLGEAFSGRLVPQHPSDEPASVLLERIAQERAVRGSGWPRRGRRKTEVAA